MKKILFLFALVATTYGFAQSIAIVSPGSVGVNLAGATGNFSINYSVTTADIIYIEAKIGGTLVGSRAFTPTVFNGTLTTANFTFNLTVGATRNVGDIVDVTAIQYPAAGQIASVLISFTLVNNPTPFITLTPPTEADVMLVGSTPFKIRYYTNTAGQSIFIEAKKGGVAVGGRTIPAASVMVGVVTDVEWPNLNKFTGPTLPPINVGDVLTWQANQFGPTLSSPVVNFTIVGGSLGVESFTNSSIIAYPNPVQDILTISGDDTTDTSSYNVLDITGRIVIKNIPATKNIDLSSLKTGQYFLISDKNSTLRVMKL
jgi:Secretion system C-terminal sorting domain